MGKVVITRQLNRLLLTLFDEKRPTLMETSALPDKESKLGNIYLARVQDVVKGIHGAFLALSPEERVYLPLADCKNILCANRNLEEGELPRQGDELVVQISGEAVKTKPPTASAKLTLTGQYCVCNYFGHGLVFSKKMDADKKKELEEAIRSVDLSGRKKYGFTIRTNAGNLEDISPLMDEMKKFLSIFEELTENYQHRTLYSCFYETEAEIVRLVKDLPMTAYEEIVTDEPVVFELLYTSLYTSVFDDRISSADRTDRFGRVKDSFVTESGIILRLYQDDMLSLTKLYSIETHIKEALSKKVWLSCGGYLVIEPTEAMVVIDVNSGKTESKGKKARDYFWKVNLEAAKEIARQLKLRNLSGMIMVDFINMESKEDNKKLMQCLDNYLKEDKVPTRLVDMTALGIVEITRKKVRKPLTDYFREAKGELQK